MKKEDEQVAIVETEEHGYVTVMKLKSGTTNPINMELIKEISDTLKMIRENPSSKAVVLTGSNEKFFSIGFDLPKLFKQGKKEMGAFFEAYNRLSLFLYTYPKPTVAALGGHAIAGGCILAVCCDYRVIASGRKLMGLNEIKLGLPVPYPGAIILKETIGSRYSQMIMEMGDFYGPEELMQMGMVNQIEKQKGVLRKAIEQAKLLGGYPAQAFSMIKRNRVEPVKEYILQNLMERESYFIKCWFSKETRELLKEAQKKF